MRYQIFKKLERDDKATGIITEYTDKYVFRKGYLTSKNNEDFVTVLMFETSKEIEDRNPKYFSDCPAGNTGTSMHLHGGKKNLKGKHVYILKVFEE